MLSLRRSFINPKPRKSTAPLSILCRGKPIAREELFGYTNGHFLLDEETQLRRRYLKFDIDALCDLAAPAGGNLSPIRTIEKIEGGFSKALLLTKENGDKVIAKLPFHIAGPAALTTASEVAVLQCVKKYTSIPVPGVLSWSSDSSNPVGAEYIIMETAAGVPLYERWDGMAEIERLGLIRNLTKLEAQLSAIAFPAYGGLYRRVDAAGIQPAPARVGVDSSEQYCVGPSCDPSWYVAATDSAALRFGSVSHGPWRTLSDLGTSIADREILRITHRTSPPRLPFQQGSIEEQTQLLETTTRIIKQIESHSLIPGQYTQPTLWHTDLHMGNIFVAPDETSRIVSLIDFQSLSCHPLFLQARCPDFLKPPVTHRKGLGNPKLPDGFTDLDEESQAVALQEFAQAKLAKAYDVANFLEDRVAYNAVMNVPRVFRELFVRCGEVSVVGIVPLRECLIEIWRNWSALGFQGKCPYAFSDEEISRHERQFAEYQVWNEVRQLAMECLGTDAEGWIAPQLDVAEKRRQNRELLAMWIERAAEERSSDEARGMWPFG
ncbi:phosphotransferase enzyme family protein [Aspergillus uvarum CBS 121591]|uniref:Altered inheritance of mitochondria protein 9, mitochondrial n=1 Tax=Aspergillus uvarum CBS 121591 TaxID=1448315 RepID=A0A319CB08_9EURO|nr:phosphotransferase enzyme family protein [Aspergillus uvarum CBS 121591]PYH75683.1 phosphotransferase enzyme family protein [Aspergillus uvarum CBS 121591]